MMKANPLALEWCMYCIKKAEKQLNFNVNADDHDSLGVRQ